MFDLHAREAVDALTYARVAQLGYVAAGQGEAFWMNKVTASTGAVTAAPAWRCARPLLPSRELRLTQPPRPPPSSATSIGACRDYLTSGQPLMGADVIFSEGSDAAATAGRQVETARLAEHQAFDLNVAEMQRQQAIIAGAAAGAVALVVLLLVPIRRAAIAERRLASLRSTAITPAPVAATAAAVSADKASPTTAETCRAAANIATDFGRVRDLEELTRILGRAAGVLDASGLMVWMATTSGGDLRPVLAHGYSSEMVARIPPVGCSANNAAAAAYRSGTLQIVLSRPGVSSGAVVAPILSADGCIGALTAEIRRRR